MKINPPVAGVSTLTELRVSASGSIIGASYYFFKLIKYTFLIIQKIISILLTSAPQLALTKK